jgi:hypothetical protein
MAYSSDLTYERRALLGLVFDVAASQPQSR